jgi:hypothetical protein
MYSRVHYNEPSNHSTISLVFSIRLPLSNVARHFCKMLNGPSDLKEQILNEQFLPCQIIINYSKSVFFVTGSFSWAVMGNSYISAAILLSYKQKCMSACCTNFTILHTCTKHDKCAYTDYPYSATDGTSHWKLQQHM